MTAITKIARLVGILTLVIVFIAPFSMIYVPSTLIVAGDAAATAQNILTSEGLFRLGIASDALVFLIEIALTVLIYALLKPAGKTLSLIAAFARLAMTVAQGLNLLNLFFVLLLLGGASYLTVFTPDQLQALALLFLNAHDYVVVIWGLFFGLHLLVLSYLVYRSGYIHQAVGFALFAAALCYLIPHFGSLLAPQYQATFKTITGFSAIEIIFPLWLLIKGVDVQRVPTMQANDF